MLLFVEILSPLLSRPQHFPRKVASPVSRREFYLEISRNCDKRTLDKIVLNIVGVWWVGSASFNSVQTKQTEERRIDELPGNRCAGARP